VFYVGISQSSNRLLRLRIDLKKVGIRNLTIILELGNIIVKWTAKTEKVELLKIKILVHLLVFFLFDQSKKERNNIGNAYSS